RSDQRQLRRRVDQPDQLPEAGTAGRGGDLVIWKSGNLEIWKCGNVGMWKSDFHISTSHISTFLNGRQLPAVAVLAAEEVVGVLRVRDSHVLRVVIDLRAPAKRHDAEEHDLDEPRGVRERARRLAVPLRRL